MKKAPNNSQPLAGFKESFTKFGTGSVAGVNYLIIVAFVVMIAVYIILNMTTLGKNIYATGGNREAAKVAGINVFKIDMFVYILSGALAALAGCMLAARTGSANATYAEGYEMDAIASCIIGVLPSQVVLVTYRELSWSYYFQCYQLWSYIRRFKFLLAEHCKRTYHHRSSCT